MSTEVYGLFNEMFMEKQASSHQLALFKNQTLLINCSNIRHTKKALPRADNGYNQCILKISLFNTANESKHEN